jgi:HSP20 family protein
MKDYTKNRRKKMSDLANFRKRNRSDISRFDKNYNDYYKSLFEQFPWFPRDFLIRDMRFPAADILEDKKRITVKAEIPGVNADDLDISLDGRRLTIKGEKKQERKKTEENLHRVERSYGRFRRTIELPAKVDQAEVEASYKRGVLKIELMKSEESQAKKITVK